MRSMRYQPQGGAKIDRGNPLGAKVIEHLPLDGRSGALVSGARITYGPAGSTRGGAKGLGLRGQGSGARASVPLDLTKYSAITIAFWLWWDGYANDDALAMELGATYGTNSGFIVDPNCSSPAAFMFGSGQLGATGGLATFPRPSAGAWHRIALVIDRAVAAGVPGTAYVDGVAQAMTPFPGATTTSGNFASDTLHLLSRNESALFGTGSLQDITFYRGALSPTEAAQDCANPWQIFTAPREDDEVAAPAGLILTPIAAALSMAGFTATISQARVIAPAAASLTLTGYAPTITQPVTLSPAGAALALQGFTPTVTQAMPQTIAPAGAALSLVGGTPAVTQGTQAPPSAGGGGGGAGPVGEVRAFGDLLDRARKPTRSQKRKRRQQLETEALELLPDLPEAEKLAPIAARIVFEQEARAMAPLYADRPIQAMAPVVMPFDAGAALRELIAHLVAEAELQQLDADDESDIELLLLGS